MAVAPAESSTGTMEALFRPSARLRDLHPNCNLPEGFTELELLPGLIAENILATGVTWKDFFRFLDGKLVLIAPGVYISSEAFYVGGDPWVLSLEGDGVYVRSGAAAAAATATCDFLVRLLATCESHGVSIEACHSTVPPPMSGAGLSLFFQESRSCLRQVTLYYMALSADQCRALATMSRLDVELKIIECSLADDAAVAFAECLQSDRGPMKLHYCTLDNQILANALSGDSRVTRFTPDNWTNDANMAILFTALANNRGLVDLDLGVVSISDDNWIVLCESLKTHLTLTNLDLSNTSLRSPFGVKIVLADNDKAHRTNAIAEMVQRNTVLHTIHLWERERDQKIYAEEILPYLETNLYRPRVLAVKKTIERPFREKVLGRALHCVKSNPNLVWMFLSENVDAFGRSEEQEEEEVGNSEVPVAAAAPLVLAVAGSSKRKQ
jgi:hypothetical protein